MTAHCRVCLLLAAALAGCGPPSPEQVRQEAARLRRSFDKHRPAYLRAIEATSLLVPESLAWLNGPATTAPRAQAVAEAHRLTERWARVYFAPRYIHEQLRHDEYSTPQVRAAHRRLLSLLKQRYFELHDYQRYAQHAAESSIHGAAPGRLPQPLQEFRRRLEARRPAVDEVTPLLDSLPR